MANTGQRLKTPGKPRILGKSISINVRKVLWTAEEIGIDYTREDWGAGFRSAQEPEFLALNPKGLVPVLIDGDLVLSESNTIIRYLAAKARRVDLLPDIAADRAGIEQWMDWQATEFNTAWRYGFQALVRKNPACQDKMLISASIREWNAMVGLVERQLQRTAGFIAGNSFTLADVVIGLSVNRWRLTDMEKPGYPAVEAYYARLRERPAFQRYSGEGTD